MNFSFDAPLCLFHKKKTTQKFCHTYIFIIPQNTSPRMNDTLILVSESLLLSNSPDSLLAFVKLQATSRAVWLHYRHDTELWKRLGACLPQWSLPEHMGLRRR